MKLRFEPGLDYQMSAIEAVCDLFRGQELQQNVFSNVAEPLSDQLPFEFFRNRLQVGNALSITSKEVLNNLRLVQMRNGLPPSENITSGDFTVEMETGTGKTYVFLRTIFELNQRFGFSKFVIVVPSIAVKEGVYRSLTVMQDHFRSLYAGVVFNYFVYDSNKLGEIRSFADSPDIQIMVTTVGAINKKDVNNLYKRNEVTDDERPIELLKATHPIVIVDEPQSVDGGLNGAGKRALEAMNPLCTLRYSATHADKHQMIYRLDAVDAYESRLVKQVEVAAASVEDAHNKPYVRLISMTSSRGSIGAAIELDVATKIGAQRRTIVVHDGDDLERLTQRSVYADFGIGEIRSKKEDSSLELRTPEGAQYLRIGQSYGDLDILAIQRQMIRRTIKEHLEKEKRLRPRGIKVLSLFFIDEVSRYRSYDANGNVQKGEYAQIFEEEYLRLASNPEYSDVSNSEEPVADVHDGYFSIDRRSKRIADTEESNQAGRDAAERAYELIMSRKESLLSFDTPLRFIFSHSALREGWDNPNIFQICTLRKIQTERERRQTIGRGLRLCVDQNGERVHGFDVNTLTVIANESYEHFAEQLQKEIQDETGIRFGVVEPHQFANATILFPESAAEPLGVNRSKMLWQHFLACGYFDVSGRILDDLRSALKDGRVDVPEAFRPVASQILLILRRAAGRIEIKNADERHSVKTRQAVLLAPDFKALWDRIKDRTKFQVDFDNETLIRSCVRGLQAAPTVMKTRIEWRKADIAIGRSGIEASERDGAQTVVLDQESTRLPDLLSILQDRTQLTRRSLYRILLASERLDDFIRNPQAFIDLSVEVINRCKRLSVVDGIRYQRLGNDFYYAQELFEREELSGYLRSILNTEKSIYEKVICQSEAEATFAKDLEQNGDVKLYVKLPRWFSIPTPLGKYTPDWAVLMVKDGEERLYLVVESKRSSMPGDLRTNESAKIECAKEHFSALIVSPNPASYVVAQNVSELMQL